MPVDWDRIEEAIRLSVGDKLANEASMRLGNPLTGEIPDEDNDIPGMVYVHGASSDISAILGGTPIDPDDDGQFISSALLTPEVIDQGLLIYNAPVRVVKSGLGYRITGLDGIRATEFFKGLKERPQRSIDLSQLDFGLIQPLESSSGLRVLISSFKPVMEDTAYWVPNLESDDLTSLIPTDPGKAVAVKFEVDPVTNTIIMEAGSEFDNTSHELAFLPYYPKAVLTTAYLVGWVKLYYQMTQVAITDILHAQELFNKGGGGGGDIVVFNNMPLYWRGNQIGPL